MIYEIIQTPPFIGGITGSSGKLSSGGGEDFLSTEFEAAMVALEATSVFSCVDEPLGLKNDGI
jgi:hypothetical protein